MYALLFSIDATCVEILLFELCSSSYRAIVSFSTMGVEILLAEQKHQALYHKYFRS